MTTRLTKPPVKTPASIAELDAILNAPEPSVIVMPDGSTKPEPGAFVDPALFFIIKPTDKLATAAIRAWIGEAYMEGVNADKIANAVEHYNKVMAWQAANPDKVKVPD